MGDITIRIDDKGATIEHQLILATHMIDIEGGHRPLLDHLGHLLMPFRGAIDRIGAAIDIDVYHGTGLEGPPRRAVVPDIFANTQGYLSAFKTKDAGLRAFLKVTLLIKHLVVGQMLLAVVGNDLAMVDHHRLVKQLAVFPLRVTDDDGNGQFGVEQAM